MKTRTLFIGLLVFIAAVLIGNGATLRAQVPEPVEKAGKKIGTTVTDSWIKMKIYTSFAPEKTLDDSDIDVDIKNGAVTLNGTVVTAAGRERAVAIAKGTDGVKGVTNNLRIAPAGTTAKGMSDGSIKARIYGQFASDSALEGSDINLDVDDGVVTLKGTVRSEAGRARAVAIAKGASGVKSVKDTLTIAAHR
jgi:osmotically-inducible protein OsmY